MTNYDKINIYFETRKTTMKKAICIILTIFIFASSMCINCAAVDYADNFPNTHRNTGHNLADLIAVAKTQIGYTELSTSTGKPLVPGQDGGYTKYGAWFGMPTVAWCAFFVTWCSNQAGISTSVIPRMGNCAAIANWFGERGRYFKRGELAPRTGDLIFYNWAGGSTQKHIGIVTGVSGGYVYTVEGNTGSRQGYRAEAKSRPVSAGYIIGYARPDYNDAKTYVGSFSFAQYAAQKYKFAQSQSGALGDSQTKRTSTLAVITSSATEISASDAVLHGRVDNQSSYPVTSAGFYFGENKSSLSRYRTTGYTNKKSTDLSCNIAEYACSLEMLKTYYYCAWATINGTTYKGPVYSLKTIDDRPQMLVLSDDELTMSPGETYELFTAILPLEALDNGISWSISNNDVVEVSNGTVKAKNVGSAVITAQTNYGSACSACSVTVTLPSVNDIQSENISENEIKIKWSAIEQNELTGYEIYRSEIPDDDFTLIGKAKANKTEFTDSSVQPGKCYYYRVRCLGETEDYNSPLSSPHRERALPAQPEIENIIQNGKTLQIEIKDAQNGLSYTIYRSRSKYSGYIPIGTTACSYYYDSDIVIGEKYFYRVSADTEDSQSRISEPYIKQTDQISQTVDDFIFNMLSPEKPLLKEESPFNPASEFIDL